MKCISIILTMIFTVALLLPVMACNTNAASTNTQSSITSSSQTGNSNTHILIPSRDYSPPVTGPEAPDDIVITPGGNAYRANVHQQGVPDRWPSIETVEVPLGSGADMVYLRYRNSIETNAGESRNNIFNIRKANGLLDMNGLSTLNLYATEIPPGITLVQEGGAGLIGTIAGILVIEIPQGMQPGEYPLMVGLEINGQDYGTVQCNIEVLKPTAATSPISFEDDTSALVYGNSTFAFDLYHKLKESEQDNFFYSPYSISTALAMTYAGANGETAQQMAGTLHFEALKEKVPVTFKKLAQTLDNESKIQVPTTAEPGTVNQESKVFRFNVANALWGQENYPFLSTYLEVVNDNYGGGLKSLDFVNAPEPSRQQINQWVSNQTENKINDLLAPGTVNTSTRLVLTNAVYFNAHWANEFQKDATHDDIFNLLDGTTVTVPMMEQKHEYFQYDEGDNYQAISLPYAGNDFSMVILLPAKGQFTNFENALDVQKCNSLIREMTSREINLNIPKFKFDSDFQLSPILSDLGIKDAFQQEAADFSGMTGNKDLYIDKVIHKAYISVDEEGTEAAAATAVMMAGAAPPENAVDFIANRPFIFLIRENTTGTILFMGRVMNPGV